MAYIEVLMAIFLLLCILVPLSPYVIMQLRYYQEIEDILEIQYHAQIGMDEFIDKTLFTKGIQQILFYDIEKRRVKKVIFDNSALGNPSKNMLVVEYNGSSKSLWYGYGSQANVQYANYIDSFILKPLGDTYVNSNGVHICITTTKGNSTFLLENEIYFRNFSN